ncbi:MAG: hypothetical protein EA412_13435 [Chitinophagaceae bacterium]|nr:MAG: hypothetical protein EA412_13435 [Chitinophagaceae bacterium]
MEIVKISPPQKNELSAKVELPLSKSILNRQLIIHALNGTLSELNLPETLPEDSLLLHEALNNKNEKVYCGHGGTTFRFLLAYFSLKKKPVVFEGSNRLGNRPAEPLINALEQMGHTFIRGKENLFPLTMIPAKEIKTNSIEIEASHSSQFISALLLIAPYLPQGLIIKLKGKTVSEPYIYMTIALMEKYGIKTEKFFDGFKVKPGEYKTKVIDTEGDWSSASYWIALASLSKKAKIELFPLDEKSIQGDSKLLDWMDFMGLKYHFNKRHLYIESSGNSSSVPSNLDFSDTPDLMMTMACWAKAKNMTISMKGLETLAGKESDRVKTTQMELDKISLSKGGLIAIKESIETHSDHRIALAMSVFGIFTEIEIQNPDVIRKSYPGYWNDMKQAGFSVDFYTTSMY